MRIALFSDTYYPYVSGVVVSVHTLKKALEEQGHTVYIVTVNLENKKFIYDKNEKIIRLPGLEVNIPGGKFVYPFSIQTLKYMKKWKIDIIHTQTEFGIGTLGRIIGKQLNIPIVHTYHTMYDDYLYYITKGYFDRLSHIALNYITKISCDKTISELIVTTDKVKELFLSKYDISREIHVVPNGLDTMKFNKKKILKNVLNGYKQEFGIQEGDFILGFLGRVAMEKNIDFLVNAMPKIIKYNKKIKLMICGSGNAEEHLKQLVKKKHIEENVIFTGLYPYDSSAYYYHLCDVFVMASKSETQGITVIEALASSKPVVCINDKAYDVALIEGYNGYIFNNEDEYIKKIKYLYENPDKLKDMSKNALESSEKHSFKNFANNVLKVYEQALNNKKRIPVNITIANTIKEVVKEVKDEQNNNTQS